MKITPYLIIAIVWFTNLNLNAQETGSKKNNNSKNNTIVYALPRTILKVSIEITHTSIIKGMYAEYAEKYLGMSNVPLNNSDKYEISSVTLSSENEPDPSNYYSLTYKNNLANIQNLLSVNNCGIMIDLHRNWSETLSTPSIGLENPPLNDPHIINEIVKERVDTFYKTILSDTNFIKVPVFKKQIVAKNYDDLVKETAHELIKTRKRKIKLARGEYDFHPDGETLKVMFAELDKQESEYLTLFQGTKTVKKQNYTYILSPITSLEPIDVCYFTVDKGITDTLESNAQSLVITFSKEKGNADSSQLTPEKNNENQFYYRVPSMLNIRVIWGSQIITKTRAPFYQFGDIHQFPLLTK